MFERILGTSLLHSHHLHENILQLDLSFSYEKQSVSWILKSMKSWSFIFFLILFGGQQNSFMC